IGRELYTSLFRILVEQGYYNAYAGITLPNAGSVGLHEALGFVPVGVYRQVAAPASGNNLPASSAKADNTMSPIPDFVLGGDLTINRLGFGAMRITGD